MILEVLVNLKLETKYINLHHYTTSDDRND